MTAPEQHDVTACARAWQALRRAHDRVAERLSADLSDACGLSMNEFDVLLYLRARPGAEVHLTALREAVPLSQPALSRLVSRLESRGLLARSGAEHDRRAVTVCLTSAGTALIDRATQVHAAAVHEALTSRFTPEEQAELLRILGREE